MQLPLRLRERQVVSDYLCDRNIFCVGDLLRTSPPAQRARPFPFNVMILASPDPFHASTLGMIVLIMLKLRALRRLGRLRIN